MQKQMCSARTTRTPGTTIGSLEDLNAASLEDVLEWFKEPTTGRTTRCSFWRATSLPRLRAIKRSCISATSRPDLRSTRFDVWAPQLMSKIKPRHRCRTGCRRPAVVQDLGRPRSGRPLMPTCSRLLRTVLSSGKTSRLYQRLVYKDQIATAVDASPTFFEIAGLHRGRSNERSPAATWPRLRQAVDEELARFLEGRADAGRGGRARSHAHTAPGTDARAGARLAGSVVKRSCWPATQPTLAMPRLSTRRLDAPSRWRPRRRRFRDAARRWHSAGSLVHRGPPVRTMRRPSAAGADRSNGPPMPDSLSRRSALMSLSAAS